MTRLSLVVLFLLLGGCYRPPSQDQLVQGFVSRQPAYERLLAMAASDRRFNRISAGEALPGGMPESRFKEYLAIFRELGVENGITWEMPFYPGGFFVIVSSSVPIGGKGRLIGYAYLPMPPHVVERRLPISELPIEIHRGTGQRIFFRPLSGHWYLFYESDW